MDFGPTTEPSDAFSHQRKFSPAGPLVNSEFYPGWLDFWGQPHEKVDTKTIISAFNKILDLKANVNFYMFHGGTNFGFSNGQYLIINKLFETKLIKINAKLTYGFNFKVLIHHMMYNQLATIMMRHFLKRAIQQISLWQSKNAISKVDRISKKKFY